MSAIANDSNNEKRLAWKRNVCASYPTIKDAIAAGKESENGKWKWDKPSGNGNTTAYFVCKEHVNCERRMRIGKLDELYVISYHGEHTKPLLLGPRKNSAITWTQEADMKKALDQGSTPGKIRCSMLKDAAAKLAADGEDPLDHKLDEGGLEGEYSWLNRMSTERSEHI